MRAPAKVPFPGRVRHEEGGDVAVGAQYPPRVRHVRPHALEDASLTAVLRDEEDRDEARDGDDCGRGEERRRAPEVEQVPAADQRTADRNAAKDVLHALRAPEDLLRQDVRVQAAVGRLVDVVGEEQGAEHQRRRPEVRHEGEESERERHRADGGGHERAAAPERRVERVAPRADHERKRQREDPLGCENEADERRRVGVPAEDRRQVRGGRRQRPCEAEGARPEDERVPPGPGVRRRLSSRRARRERRRRSCARHGRPPRRRRGACPSPSP